MRTMFFEMPTKNPRTPTRALLTAAFNVLTVAALWLPSQSPAQSLNKFDQPGRNRVGSSIYNGVSGSGESYTIVGGGNDIWDNQDEFTYRYTEVCGDFDVKVRVESLSANAQWSKAGIMVRETLAEDSRMVFQRSTPPAVPTCANAAANGVNDVHLAYRTGKHISNADGTGRFNNEINDGRHEDGGGAATYPNMWLRVTRVGSVFTAYHSTDGVTWTLTSSQDTATWVNAIPGDNDNVYANGPMRPKVLVGLGVSRHSGGVGCETATAEFRDFMLAGDAKFCLCSADSLGCSNSVLLTFTHPVGAGATDAGNYQLSGGDFQFITGAHAGPTPNTVVLDTDPLVEGAVYTITVTGPVMDSTGASLDPGCTAQSFTHADGYQAYKVHVLYNQAPAGWGPDYNGGLVGYYFQTLSYQRGIPTAATGQPAHTNNPTYFEGGPTAIIDTEDHETHISRQIGVLQINADGDYKFACSSDDGGALFLSSDDQPINKVEIAREPQWSGTRIWSGGGGGGGRGPNACGGTENQSCAIHLLAGKKYYLEYTYAEGGGGNHGAVTWDAGTGTIPADGANMLATDPTDPIWAGKGELIPVRWHDGQIFYNLGPVMILQEPQDKTVPIGQTATFTIVLDGAPPYSIQWKTNGVAVPGATGQSFSIVGAVANNGYRVSAMIMNAWGSATTRDAILTVLLNPIILSCSSRGNCHVVYVTYNKPMNLDGTYTLICSNIDGTITPSVLSNPRYGANNNQVCLTVTPDLLPDTNTYYVTVTGATSTDGLVINPDPSTCSFVHGAEYPGFNVLYRRYNGVGNGSLVAFLGSAKYQNDQADVTLYNPTGFFEAPTGVADNYGAKVAGFYIAPQDGNYQFWMSSDDQGAIYLATDAVPAHKQQIGAEPAWGAVRAWTDAGHDNNDNRGTPPIYDPTGTGNLNGNGSLPIHLSAGQKVYLELLWTEGGGGDNGAVAVAIDAVDPNVPPINGTDPIHQDQFQRLRVAPNGQTFTTLCDVFCNPGPSDQTVFVGQTASFSATPDGTPPYTMQWKKNGVAILGANSSSYTTPPAILADEGTVYTFELSNEFSSTSCSATLHVRHEPLVVSCSTRGDPGNVYVVYNKPVQLDGTYAVVDDTEGFPVDSAGAVHYGSSQSEVVVPLVGLPADHAFTLTITGVHDTENPANLIVPDPTVCRFAQGPGRFCTDFENGLPPGTDTSGSTTPPSVSGGVLHLTDNGVTSNQNFWRIPLGGVQTFKCFSARWQSLFNGPIGNAADGISFNVGQNVGFPVAAEEGGDNGLSVTVDTFDNGGAESGIEVRWNGLRLAFTQIGGGNGPAQLERNVFVDASVDVTPSGFVTFKFDTYQVSAQIPGYTGINANQYVFAARTGGAAEDAWIDNLCINDYTLGPIAVTVSPADTTVAECSQVTFTAATTGSPCYYYQWFKNGVAIPGAINGSYTTPPLLRDSDGAVYRVDVHNDFSNASSSGTVHVTPDNIAPTFVSATRGCIDHSKVTVVFSESMDPTSANNPASYAISGGVTVSAAMLQADGRTVMLTTTPLADGSKYDLTAPGVRDCALNLLAGGAHIAINVVTSHIATGAQNMAVIEGEDYDAAVSSSGTPSWMIANTLPGFSGTGYIDASPDGGTFAGNGPSLNPRIYADYCVTFPVAGTYYFLVRGSTPNGGGNSIHISLNGADPNATYNNRIGNNIDNWGGACGDPNAFGWVYIAAAASVPSAVDVPSAGQHTFRIWMREDGVKIDQFVLTTDSSFALAPCDAPLLATGRELFGPRLTIIHNGDGSIDVSWTGGGHLECSPAIGPGASWSNVAAVSPHHIAAPTGMQFYRVVDP